MHRILPILLIVAVGAVGCSNQIGDGEVTSNTYRDGAAGRPASTSDPEIGTARITAVGALLPDPTRIPVADGWDGVLDPFAALFTGDDLTMGDLVCPATDDGTPTRLIGSHRCDPAALDALAAAGLDVVTLANEHALDQGADALAETIDAIGAAGMTPVGAGLDATSAAEPVVVERNGLRIAVVAATLIPPPMTADPDTPSVFVVDDLADVQDAVRRADAEAEVVVVSLHGGVENSQIPDFALLAAMAGAIDVGADVVVGHGAHRLHRFELDEGVPVAVGLGDFLHPFTSAPAADTAAATFTVAPDGSAVGCLIGATIGPDGRPVPDDATLSCNPDSPG